MYVSEQANLACVSSVVHVEEGIAQVLVVHSEVFVQTGTGPEEMVFFSGLPADTQSLLTMLTRNRLLCIVLILIPGFD